MLLLDGLPLRVAGTHLDLEPAARVETATLVRAEPVDILCADVNDRPGSPAWQVLAAGLIDPGSDATFPARAATRRIDALLVGPALVVLAFRVEPTSASDHLLLVADLARVGGSTHEGVQP